MYRALIGYAFQWLQRLAVEGSGKLLAFGESYTRNCRHV
jgi:hypothetical protein